MLSSTFKELGEHREVVGRAMLDHRLLPIAVDDDALPDHDLIEASLAKVDESDAYIALISRRYGQTPIDSQRNPGRLSLTELEFRRAVVREIPICIFIMHEDHPVPRRAVGEGRGAEDKYQAFVALAKKDRICVEFRSVEDLKAKVARTLSQLREALERSDAPPELSAGGKEFMSVENLNAEVDLTRLLADALEFDGPELAAGQEESGLSLAELHAVRYAAETKPAGISVTLEPEERRVASAPATIRAATEEASRRPASESETNFAGDEEFSRPRPKYELSWDDNASLEDAPLASPVSSGISPSPRAKNRFEKGWLLLLGAAAAVVVGWIFHREIVYAATSLFELFRSAVAPLPGRRGRPRPAADIVDASAFSPEECAPGETILVQIFFHRRSQASATRKRAQEADRQTTRRTFCTLETLVNHGQSLGVKLESRHFSVEDPEQSVSWHGQSCMCQFSLTLSKATTVRSDLIQASFFLDGTPIGILRFNIDVTFTSDGWPRASTLRGDSARHFDYAFLSYSSHDRREVLQCAQVLEGVGIGYFLDAVSLRGGEVWEKRLFEEIDRSDIFMLFWSKNAEQYESTWMQREATYALDRQKTSKDQLPCFRPAFLGHDRPRRPSWLPAHIQFDNALRRHLLAARYDQGDQ